MWENDENRQEFLNFQSKNFDVKEIQKTISGELHKLDNAIQLIDNNEELNDKYTENCKNILTNAFSDLLYLYKTTFD